jgi:hypothetical protein
MKLSLSRIISPTLAAGLLGSLAISIIFLWITAEGSAVPVSPHGVPVAVVGPSPIAVQLTAKLQRGGAFSVVRAPNEATALALVQTRNADAIVNIDTKQLQTVQAAAPTTALALEDALARPGGQSVQVRDLVPAAAGDPTGIGLMFICLAMVIGSILSGVLLAVSSKKRRPTSAADAGRWVAIVVTRSVIAAFFIALVADGVLGYGGSHMLVIWGWGSLLCTAATATTAAFIGALGVIPGVLLAVISLLIFGAASSPAPIPWNWNSVVFRVLGPYDPFGATTDAMRNGIFFTSATQAHNSVVLACWIVLPFLILLGFGWRSQWRESPAVVGPHGAVPTFNELQPVRVTTGV